MIYLLALLFGGLFAAAWLRIDRLERRIAQLSQEIAALAPAASRVERGEDAAPAAVAARPMAKAAAPEPVDVAAQPVPEAPVPAPESLQSAADPLQTTARPPLARRFQGFSFDFEEIFGRRLPIWGGGFALAVAGIFLVRYAIEAGLLTPLVRVLLSFVFGFVLLACAEGAYRYEARLADPRVRQALAGAGLATLYGAFYLAGTTYGLIGAGLAFLGLAAVTAGAIALSFRFGLPSAVIGLVGGFAAPLLVDSDSANVPLLSFYLALITGGLAWSGEAQERRWLSYAALAAGLGWGVLMMALGVPDAADRAALGLYLVVLGTVLPAFLHARGGPRLPHLAAVGLASLQMAVLVGNAGFAPLTWGLYLLIAAGLTGLGWRYEALRPGTLVAAGLGLGLLAMWPEPEPDFFALVAAAQVAIFAGAPLAHHALGRAGRLDLAQLGGVSLVMALVLYGHFGRWEGDASEPLLAAATAALALLPAAGFALLWRRGQERDTRAALILLAPAALLAFGALLLVTPAWLAPLAALAACAPLLLCEARRDAPALAIAAWAGAGVTLFAMAVTPGFAREITQLGGLAEPVETGRAVLRWAAALAPFAALAIIARHAAARSTAEALAVLLGYGLVAQVVPSLPLAWIAAAGAIALVLTTPSRVAAWTTALAIAAGWALVPVAGWAGAGALALLGEPFLATSAAAPRDLALRILPLAAGVAAVLWKGRELRSETRAAALLALGLLGALVLHSLFKQAFAISELPAFERHGMAERSLWQALLFVAALAAGRRLPASLRRPVGLGLVAALLAHFVWFTLILHNPLLAAQHVGPVPVANWLTLGYSAALAGLWLGRTLWPEAPAAARTASEAASMVLVALLAYSLLRQVFAGSLLIARGVNPTESLLISLLGILLALGYLWWGSWRGLRSWRIGSLVLMLVAVAKVFLVDAAGLGGLLRIASFMALGFSLIGIGWVYSRQLVRAAGDAGPGPGEAE